MKVALITYHSAYNFGSVLQAYATEFILNRLGCETTVINYRIPFQKKYYGILGYGKGIKAPFKKILMFPQIIKRIIRKQKYEDFISKMNLTQEVNSPSELNKILIDADLFISGSDQIWNLHSNEFIHSGNEYMQPYLLSFTSKRKISYASSVVNMTDRELLSIKKSLEKFDFISCREQSAVERLTRLLTHKIYKVIDPTLLLTQDSWEELLPQTYKTPGKYILYYSLKNFKETSNDLKELSELSIKKNIQIVALTPLIPNIHKKNVINLYDAGPLDFISLIKNADLIVTDSYHGMLFSITFRKKFYYLKNNVGDKGIRARDILSLLCLDSRIIDSVNYIDIENKISYEITEQKLPILRDESINYLKKAINKRIISEEK